MDIVNKKGILLMPNSTLKIVIGYLLSITFLFILNFTINVDGIALIVYISYLFFLLARKKTIIVKYLLFIISYTYHIISVFIVETSPTMLFNLRRMSYRNGAFVPLVFGYLLLFFTITLLESNSNSKLLNTGGNRKSIGLKIGGEKLTDKTKIKILTFIMILFTVIIIARIRNLGFYSMNGIDRFEYRSIVFSNLDNKFYTYILWFIPIPLLAKNIGMKKRAFIFILIYIFYLLWIGDKFGSLFTLFYLYVLVCWSTKTIDKKMMRRIFTITAFVFLILTFYISYQVIYEKGTFADVITYFTNRLTGGQSDLWWGCFDLDKNNGWRITELWDEISVIFKQPKNSLDYNFGIYKMMRFTAPSNVVDYYLKHGSRFTASTQASLFYYFKYTGLYLGSVFIGISWFNIINRAVNAFRSYDIIRSVCYTMLIQKAILLFSMSDITVFGDLTTILAIMVLIYLRHYEQKPRGTI